MKSSGVKEETRVYKVSISLSSSQYFLPSYWALRKRKNMGNMKLFKNSFKHQNFSIKSSDNIYTVIYLIWFSLLTFTCFSQFQLSIFYVQETASLTWKETIVEKTFQKRILMRKIGRYAAIVILVNHRHQNLAKRLILMSVQNMPVRNWIYRFTELIFEFFLMRHPQRYLCDRH